ncbi:AAA-like domain-containing protein [Armatimonas sp.]|uniref:AAA-like domain-containing protein n=1 Tax=Armatimonas sp. TaxID=1872638 RepID=UPI003750E10C
MTANLTETGHVLFLDLVGYSLLSQEAQAARVTELLACVRGTKAFQSAEQAGELIPIATGDGVALVFLRYALAPLICACEVREKAAGLPLRMGIHVGPVTRVSDINGAVSVTGGGINTAKRIMDLADAGQILLSDAAFALVREHDAWKERLRFVGERDTKHGERMRVWGLTDPLPLAFATARRGEGNTTPGGAVPLTSEHYVVRSVDGQFHAALQAQSAIVLLKGARQVGKTSLLARGLQAARQRGAQVVILDFQSLGSDVLASAESLYRAMAESLCEQLDLDTLPESHWSASRSGAANLERYLRRVIFAVSERPLVWGLDEADRLFPLSFGSEVFGLLRSWHNRRTLDPEGPWSRLSVAIAYATEAHLFITDPNQSPFNVGVRLLLTDFTQSEVEQLARRYQSDATAVLYALLSGHPYLTRRGLEVLTAGGTLETTHVFDDHLERLLFSLSQEPLLREAILLVLGGKAPSGEAFFRLRAAGVLAGESASEARLRCLLYENYLRKHLE